MKSWRSHLLWLIWAYGFAMCFPPYRGGLLVWVIFVPAIIYAWTQPLKQTAVFSFFYGVLCSALSMYWVIAFHEASALWVFPIIGLYTSVSFILIGYFGRVFPGMRVWITPLPWISMEFLRAIGYQGFPWSYVMHALTPFPVFYQSADIIGPYGAGYLVLLLNAFLAEAWLRWKPGLGRGSRAASQRRWHLWGVPVLLTLNVVYGIWALRYYQTLEATLPTEKVALLQANEPPRTKWRDRRIELFEKYWLYQARVASKDLDMIIYSETLVPISFWYYRKTLPSDHPYRDYIERYLALPKDLDTPILIGHPERDEQGNWYNQADLVYYDKADHMIQQGHGKIHLTPFGEWLPFSEKVPALRKLLDNIGAAWASPYPKLSLIESRQGFLFTLLLCFEDLFPQLGRLFIQKGVSYFVNMTNDGWAFRWKVGTDLPLVQHANWVRLTAVALRRAIVRVTNTGMTVNIYPSGKMDVADVPLYQSGIWTTEITVMDPHFQTFYVRVGYLFIYGMLFALVALVVYGAFVRKVGLDVS